MLGYAQFPDQTLLPTVIPKVQPSFAVSAAGMRSSGPLLANGCSFLLAAWTAQGHLTIPLSLVKAHSQW